MALLLDEPGSAVGQDYTWGCLFGSEFQITYLYGPARTCREIGAGLVDGQYQPKGRCDTLAAARCVSEAAAEALKECYGDIDGAQAISAADLPVWRPCLGLLCRGDAARSREFPGSVRQPS